MRKQGKQSTKRSVPAPAWPRMTAAMKPMIGPRGLATTFIILLVAGSIFRLVRVSLSGGNIWITGDWLIRYADGFVRRGLLGEIAWTVSSLPGLSLLWAVTALQIFSFISFATFSILLFLQTTPRASSLLMFVSPAFLAFHFWDLQGGFRKEIFALAVFAFLLWISTQNLNGSMRKTMFLAGWSLAPALFAFVHEALVFFAPLMLIALWLVRSRVGVSAKSLWVTTIVGALLLVVPIVLSLLHPGDERESNLICMSAVSRGFDPSICSGAISALGWTGQEAYEHVAENATPIYALLAAIALLPFLAERRRRGLVVSIGVASLALVPIFVLGADWGRWIHIFVALLTLTVFAVDRRPAGKEVAELAPRVTALLLVVFALGWHLPHFAASYWGPQVIDIGRNVLGAFGFF